MIASTSYQVIANTGSAQGTRASLPRTPWVHGKRSVSDALSSSTCQRYNCVIAFHVTCLKSNHLLIADWSVAPFSPALRRKLLVPQFRTYLSVVSSVSLSSNNSIFLSIIYDDVIRRCVYVIVVCDDSVDLACSDFLHTVCDVSC